MSEKQRRVLEKLGDKYPHMDEFQKGYLEGTVNTAAAMSTLKIEKSGPFCGTEADILHCMRHAKEILPCFSL